MIHHLHPWLYVCCLFVGFASAAAPPNIIIVMPDDMGYGDLGATGNPVIRTPNLDRFANESSQLTNFYVSPVCSPTRACVMTGRYNYRTRVIDTFKGRSMMDPAEVTIAEVLGDAGYATGIFGKWHLGDNYPMRPQDQGFDEVLVHRGGGLAQPSEPIENDNRYTDPILFRNGRQVQTEGYCTDVYFDAAIEFMESSRKAGKPFFVYLPPNAPHGPFHDVPEDLLEYYQSVDLTPALLNNRGEQHRDTVARVFAMVENIDQNFGKLESYLRSKGLHENTLVMFLTDNGPNTKRYVGPFREMKTAVHEGGIHTMFFARWPAGIKKRAKADPIAAHIDILPTVLAAAGVEKPEELHIDGRNLLPLLDGTRDVDWADRTLFLQTHRGDEPVMFHHFSARGQHWKLVHPTGFGSETLPEDVPFELYRVDRDRGESDDLADEHPERVESLKSEYQAWFTDVSSTRNDNYAPPRIVIGSDAETTSDLSIQDWRVEDSEGWGTVGKWKVEIVSVGPYDASVRWANAIGSREIVLHIGENTFPGTLRSDATEVSFPAIELPLGEVDIHVDIRGKKPTKDEIPRFVTLNR